MRSAVTSASSGDDRVQDLARCCRQMLGGGSDRRSTSPMTRRRKRQCTCGAGPDHRVARGAVDEGVERDVVGDHGLDRTRLHRLEAGLEDALALAPRVRGDLGRGGAALRRQPRGESVECRTNLIAVAHHLQVERRHDEAAPAGILDDAVTLEQQQRLLDGLPGDAVALGQDFLNEMGVRRERAIGDLAEERFVGLLDQAGLGREEHYINPNSEFGTQYSIRRCAVKRNFGGPASPRDRARRR